MKNILLLIASFLIFSCQEEGDVQTQAKLVTLEDMKSQIGFVLFDSEYDSYQPNSDLVQQIKESYDSLNTDFFLFIEPTCKCLGNTESVPKIFRILNDAGINSEHVKIYSMLYASMMNPDFDDDPNFNLNSLPSFFVRKQNTNYIELFSSYSGQDSTSEDTLENYLLEALNN